MKIKKTCPICEGKKVQKFAVTDKYQLVKCLECTHVWDANPPKNIAVQYEKDYFSNDNYKGGYANYFEGMEINKKTFSLRLKRIEKELGKKGKLLDVGCALGHCLDEAKKLGWKGMVGVELSDYACRFAAKKGHNVVKGTIQTAKLKRGSFDTITMQDVIEHVTSPIDDLKAAKRLLKKGGKIYLVTPDIGGLWNRLLGPRWYHYKPGEHIMYFSQGSLRKALKHTGFKNIKTAKTYHIMSLAYILNRLKYYSPSFFGLLLTFVNMSRLKDIPFRVYAGEIEAWGER